MTRPTARSQARAAARLAAVQALYQHDMEKTPLAALLHEFHNHRIGATIEDVDAVGRLVDTAIGSGANRVAQISFFAADTEDARREALAMAVESAREDAEVIASSLGHELGAALEINGGGNRITPQFYSDGPAMSRAAATPIEVGDQSVSANVSIRFALGREVGG